jgi:hypothetical protein
VPRTLVIGDVHGCSAELDALLEQFHPGPDDRIVFVGDLVAKGPDSKGVVERARAMGALGVRGNHDEKCLAWRQAVRADFPGPDAPDAPGAVPTLSPTHQAVCDALDGDDWAWLESLPYWLRLPEHDAIVVHAGLVPGRPLEAQEQVHMLHMRSVRPDGSVSSRVDAGVPWGSRWPGPEEVIYGHDALRGLQRHAHATGLDTGCVYGGALTGYVLPTREIITIPAQRVWSHPDAGPQS